MPASQAHVLQAEKNESLYLKLNSPALIGFEDWQITSLFYSALHYVDAVLGKAGIHPTTHTQRAFWISHTSKLSGIERNYRLLEDYSRQARYDLQEFNRSDAQEIKSQNFDPLKRHLLSALG